MKKINWFLLLVCFIQGLYAQEIEFEEYDLPNGLHVILHQDNSTPIVVTSVLYKVGPKDEAKNRTGFAHFFEHLLFEETQNIPRGKWSTIVTSRGGQNNAYTSGNYTYYYEALPANELDLALWMESERMLHPIIGEKGVATQNEVVKEEKRLRYDNRPYGKWFISVYENLFTQHPYQHSPIGKMADLDAATLEEFLAFNNKFYVPNNAVLTIAGAIDIASTKQKIEAYFGSIPRGKEIKRNYPKEPEIKKTITAQTFDANIQLPALLMAYKTPGESNRENQILEMIASYLSDGKSSRLYKRMVDKEKLALSVNAYNFSDALYSPFMFFSIPLGETSLSTLQKTIDEEIKSLQDQLIDEKDYEKLLNKFESQFVSTNASISGIANSLAHNYVIHGDTNLINTQIDRYRSITREEIQAVAQKYLNPNQRLELEYLPEPQAENPNKS
ncbi:MAG: pitrilysin family protein [Flavobacteriaceae bacterium]|jgi:predicted Zn-dependent peptidase